MESICRRKVNVTQKLKIVLGRIENTVGKRQNAGIHHFLCFPRCFQNRHLETGLIPYLHPLYQTKQTGGYQNEGAVQSYLAPSRLQKKSLFF